MPTEAYALCPRRPMPDSTSYESSKGYRSELSLNLVKDGTVCKKLLFDRMPPS